MTTTEPSTESALDLNFKSRAIVINTHPDGQQFVVAAFWHTWAAEEFAALMNQGFDERYSIRYSVQECAGQFIGGAR